MIQTLFSSQSEVVWGFQKVCMQCTAWNRRQDSADVSITGCFVGVAKIASASSCIWKTDRWSINVEILPEWHYKMVFFNTCLKTLLRTWNLHPFGTFWWIQSISTFHLLVRTAHLEIAPEWIFEMGVEMYSVLTSRTPQSKGICHQMLGDTSP